MNVSDVRSRRALLRLVLPCMPIAVLAAAGGCTPAVHGSAGPRFGADTLSVAGRPHHGGGSESFQVSRKQVGAKEEPATLVADDGSRCTVTKGRFKKTREGDYVTCAWRRNDR